LGEKRHLQYEREETSSIRERRDIFNTREKRHLQYEREESGECGEREERERVCEGERVRERENFSNG